MPDPVVLRFKIDNVVPTGFEANDTRHNRAAGKLTAQRIERFPGSRSGYSLKGRTLLPNLIVTGWMRAANVPAIYDLIATYETMQENLALLEIKLHDVPFINCDLVEFSVIDPHPIGYVGEGMTAAAPGAKIRVRFTFAQLQS